MTGLMAIVVYFTERWMCVVKDILNNTPGLIVSDFKRVIPRNTLLPPKPKDNDIAAVVV